MNFFFNEKFCYLNYKKSFIFLGLLLNFRFDMILHPSIGNPLNLFY